MTAPRIYVGGTQVAYEAGSLTFDRTVQKRSTCRFTILDYDTGTHYNRLVQCRIHDGDDGRLVWSGYLEQIDEVRIGKVAALRVSVSATDATALLDARLVADVFESVDSETALATVIDNYVAAEDVRFHDYDLIVADDGAIAHWPLVEAGVTVANDLIGSLDGTYANVSDVGAGDPVIVTVEPSLFAGADDAMSVADDSLAPANYTYEVWVRVNGLPSSFDDFVDLTTDVAAAQVFMRLNSDGTIDGSYRDDANTSYINLQSTSTFGAGDVVHCVLTWDGSTARWYINGTEEASNSTTAPLTGNSVNQFGIHTAVRGSNDLDVDAQHLAVYDSALTAAQVTDHYEAGANAYNAGTSSPTIVDSGLNISRLAANYEPATEVVNRIAQRIAYDWWIDERFVVHWQPRGSADAPATVDTSLVLDDVTVSRKNTRYRNRQVVRGGVAKTDPLTERFQGDGDQTTFVVGYPLAEEPTVEVDTGSGFVTETVGIRGVNSDDGSFDWFWSKGSPEVNQSDNNTAPASGDVIRITFVGQFPFVAVSGDTGEQQRIANLGHGTGIVEVAEDVPDSTGREEAFDVAAGLLGRWAQDHRIVKFRTRTRGFAAGQVANVDLPLHGLSNDELLLESVDAEVSEGGTLTYTIKGTEGPFDGRWTEYFEKVIEDARQFVEREATADETLVQQTVDVNESWTLTESQSAPTTNSCPLLAQTVPFTVC